MTLDKETNRWQNILNMWLFWIYSIVTLYIACIFYRLKLRHTNDCSACIWESSLTSVHHCVTKSKALTAHSRHEALCTLLEAWGAEGKSPKHTAKDENSSSSWEQDNWWVSLFVWLSPVIQMISTSRPMCRNTSLLFNWEINLAWQDFVVLIVKKMCRSMEQCCCKDTRVR